MTRIALDSNPYAPPRALPSGPPPAFALVSEAPASSFRPRVFQVGVNERHVVEVRINVWTGEETYLVDGQERLRTSTWWGRRAFSVGEKETHDVEVCVAASGRISVFVDRQLAHANLFPALALVPVAVLALIFGLGLLAVGGSAAVTWLLP